MKYSGLLASIMTTFVALHLSCKDMGTGSSERNWVLIGLEGKLVSRLKLINGYLYACAGKDGLFRIRMEQNDPQWEYLGLAEPTLERVIESGVTDIISIDTELLVSYVAGSGYGRAGIYRSTNGGVTWLPSDSGMILTPEYPTSSQIIRLAQFGTQPRHILAGTTVDLVYRSTDGGISWERIFGTVGASSINYAISCRDPNQREIWVGGETGFFAPFVVHSSDGGDTWSDRISFPADIGPYTYDNAVYDIVPYPNGDSTVYFAMLGAIVKTTDKGETFERILGWEDGVYRHWRLEMNPGNPEELLATGFNLYHTNDGGVTWQKIKPPLFEIYALEVDWGERVLYVSVSSPENGIYKLCF